MLRDLQTPKLHNSGGWAPSTGGPKPIYRLTRRNEKRRPGSANEVNNVYGSCKPVILPQVRVALVFRAKEVSLLRGLKQRSFTETLRVRRRWPLFGILLHPRTTTERRGQPTNKGKWVLGGETTTTIEQVGQGSERFCRRRYSSLTRIRNKR